MEIDGSQHMKLKTRAVGWLYVHLYELECYINKCVMIIELFVNSVQFIARSPRATSAHLCQQNRMRGRVHDALKMLSCRVSSHVCAQAAIAYHFGSAVRQYLISKNQAPS
jgi:hypothetical protein